MNAPSRDKIKAMPTVKKPGRALISAHALSRIHTCAHFWHLQCFGDATKLIEPDAGAQLRIDAGVDHEQEVIAKLDVIQPKYPEERPWDGIGPTLRLMEKGVPLIYQGVLKNGRMFGIPDLLELTKTRSKFGKHSYRPVDIKSHSQVTKKDKLQLAAYALMLQDAQAATPQDGAIILRDKSRTDVSISGEIASIETALAVALAVEKKKAKTHPIRCSECGYCPWREHCDAERREKKLVTLLAGTDIRLVRKLIEEGMSSYDTVAKQTPKQIAERLQLDLERAIVLKQGATAWKTGSPVVLKKITFPSRRRTIIHYDIETYGDTLYLHGLLIVRNRKATLHQFVARSVDEEEKALADFLSFILTHDDPVVFTWTTFENSWLQKMGERYPKHRKSIEKILIGFQDLKELVKSAVALPVTTFSIKEVAPVFGFAWRASDAGGSASEAWYDNWLETGDETILQKILHYNEDDVRAMDVVLVAVRDAMTETVE